MNKQEIIKKINKQIDNTGDFNNVRKVNDVCRFMGCKGKVKFDRYAIDIHDKDKKQKIVLLCPKCRVENWKDIKKK